MDTSQLPKPNRLIDETSPYLRQHAHNPVDWYAWGEEALAMVRQEDKPIFLSIGYSACHWCHVMEHESFENPAIAELMNRWFVCIKVDREERPDLDQIYMNSVMALSGHGGWPMSVFLTPDLKPFYGGTYWPPRARMGMPGFGDILEKVNDAWRDRRDDVHRGADELTDAVVRMSQPHFEATQLSVATLENALRSLLRTADSTHGGFGSAPKFPHPMDLRLLLRLWKRFGNADALQVAELTLDKMSCGGIYDHLGGGFHRYATDAIWLVPHFEKMLYDNSLLVPAYLEAFQATGNADYARVVRETLDYVLREMTQPEGGFYSTQDADSEGVEGKFFVWSEAEIDSLLDADEARVFKYCYDVQAAGNWEEHNILNRVKPHDQAAKMLGVDPDELAKTLDGAKRKLFEVRSRRIAPGRDDKLLVSWNGLMIAAMSLASQVLDEPKYAEAASRAADFILAKLRTADGGLLHSYKDGQAKLNGYLDDYACLIDGLVELYQATFHTEHLDAALAIAERMIAKFYDADGGGFFYTSSDHERLIVRSKDSHDSATPSGNSMAATALLKLGRLCGRGDLEEKGVAALEMMSGQLAKIPQAGGQALIALDFLRGPTYEVAIVEGRKAAENNAVLKSVHARFLPNKVLLRRPVVGSDAEIPAAIRTLLAGKTSRDGGATVYLCERGACQEPVVGVERLATALDKLS